MNFNLNRRDVLAKSAYAALASGLAIAVSGLAQETNGEFVSTSVPEFVPINGSVSANHGHNALLTIEQIQSKSQVTRSIQGESGHSHNLDISPEDLNQLRQGNSIQVVSSTDFSHSHTVVFTPTFGKRAKISNNHDHDAFLSPEVFSVLISIQGKSGHQHSIRLTAEDLVKIGNGEPVNVSSTEDRGHSHIVSFNA
ncbi:MAG: hypothetical protein NT027_03435 [Proteobacteria bacterium]|nr:hypothetical protein [Pseudomonadota bacterium]